MRHVQVCNECILACQCIIFADAGRIQPLRLYVQVHSEAKAQDLEARFIWLDFLDDLLEQPAATLKPELQFDGTHLAPTYTQYLDKALQHLH